ncbi:MAG TPA: phosphatase PAP2 family protein, partial [Candidatus Binatus sp.]|nr:phosphatase PAP2 family protein [Candidatus Binatus sp.]
MPVQGMKHSRKVVFGLSILLFGFLVTFLVVYTGIVYDEDTNTFLALNHLASSPVVADIAIVITYFGSELVLIPLAGVIYLLSKNNKLERVFLVVLAVAVSDALLILLKAAYGRPRPSRALTGFQIILPLGVDSESSFPSGHTTRAFAVAS